MNQSLNLDLPGDSRAGETCRAIVPRPRRYKTYRVIEGDAERSIRPGGRTAWMLDRLMLVGDAGCTPLETPALRMSQYIFRLRTMYGLNIETIIEQHDGPFAGHHGRYVLRSTVEWNHASEETPA